MEHIRKRKKTCIINITIHIHLYRHLGSVGAFGPKPISCSFSHLFLYFIILEQHLNSDIWFGLVWATFEIIDIFLAKGANIDNFKSCPYETQPYI